MDLFYILGAVLVSGLFFTGLAKVDGKKRYDDGFEAGYKKGIEEGFVSQIQKKSRFSRIKIDLDEKMGGGEPVRKVIVSTRNH